MSILMPILEPVLTPVLEPILNENNPTPTIWFINGSNLLINGAQVVSYEDEL